MIAKLVKVETARLGTHGVCGVWEIEANAKVKSWTH